MPSLLVACALAVSHGMQGVGISISNMISWISGNFVLHWIVRWRFGALDSSSSCRWAEAYRFQKKAHLENVSGTASVTEDPSVLPGDVSERGMSAIYIIYSVVTQGPLCRRSLYLVSAPEHSSDNVRLSLAVANFCINSLFKYILDSEIHFRGTFNVMISFQLLANEFPLLI